MSTVRDSRVETPSAFGKLQDLEWLIGTWEIESQGVVTQVTCRWVANKSFIERTHKVSRGDEEISSGIQLIGWNPQAEQIQSWIFSSDGGHAVGLWASREDGWQITTKGMLADGAETTAVNLLTPIDDNGFSWQSTERTVGGETLPDTEEVVLKRARKKPSAVAPK